MFHNLSQQLSRGQDEYPVGVEVVDGPRQAGNAVEPEAAEGEEVLEGDGPEVVAVGVGDVKPALEELDDDLELQAGFELETWLG